MIHERHCRFFGQIGWVLILPTLFGCPQASPPVWVEGWRLEHSLKTPRTGASAVVVGDHIYVIGGGEGSPGPDTIHRSIEYARIHSDGSLGPWQMTTPLKTPRMFLATAAGEGMIYALGGEYFPEGQMKLLNSVERAVVEPEGQLGQWTESSPMRTPRRSPTATVVGGFLYAIGGYNGIFLRTVERARILEGSELSPWESVPQLLTIARYIHGGVAKHGRIYVVGGHSQDTGRGSSGAEWASVDSDGQLGPWHATSPLLQPRFLAGSAATDDYIYVAGGFDGRYLASVERARIQSDGNLGVWIRSASLETPREGAAVAISGDNIYVIGGSTKGIYLRTVERARIDKNGSLGYWQTGGK
jgi:hypothetical protein